MTNLAEQINNEESNVFVFPKKKTKTKIKKHYDLEKVVLDKLKFICNEDQKYETTIISDLIVEEYKKRKQKTEKSHNDIEANKTKLEEAFVFQQVIETQNRLIEDNKRLINQLAEIKKEPTNKSSSLEIEAIENIKELAKQISLTLTKFQNYENGNLKMIEEVKGEIEKQIVKAEKEASEKVGEVEKLNRGLEAVVKNLKYSTQKAFDINDKNNGKNEGTTYRFLKAPDIN